MLRVSDSETLSLVAEVARVPSAASAVLKATPLGPPGCLLVTGSRNYATNCELLLGFV